MFVLYNFIVHSSGRPHKSSTEPLFCMKLICWSGINDASSISRERPCVSQVIISIDWIDKRNR